MQILKKNLFGLLLLYAGLSYGLWHFNILSLISLLSYILGLCLGTKAAWILRSTHSSKEDFNDSLKMFGLALIMMAIGYSLK